MDNLLIVPVLSPLVAAVVMVVFGRTLWRQRAMALAHGAITLVAGFTIMARASAGELLVLRLGNWPAPFGIVLQADTLTGLMLMTSAFLGLCISVYSQRGLHERRERRFFHPLSQLLAMGVNMSFLTADLFNLFVSFEVMLLASYCLLALGTPRRQLRAVYLYLALNVASGTVFLFSLGIVYGLLGTLNMADLAIKVRTLDTDAQARLVVAVLMLLTVFGGKAAMFPIFFWLPHSYGAAATPIVALFAGLLTKVGVYAMIRVLGGVFGPVFEVLQPLVLLLAGLTMLLGVWGAVAQTTIRRILSFHIVSQIGYMIMGVALLTPATTAGAVFFMLHNMLVKTGLLLVGGMVEMRCGTDELHRLGGLLKSDRSLAIVFFLLAMSLAGLPPFTGFWGKMMLIEAGFSAGANIIVAVSIFTSIFTLFSMLKIWNYAFWRDAPLHAAAPPVDESGIPLSILRQPALRQWAPLLAVCGLATLLGIFPERMVQATRRAGLESLQVDLAYKHVVTDQQALWDGPRPLTRIGFKPGEPGLPLPTDAPIVPSALPLSISTGPFPKAIGVSKPTPTPEPPANSALPVANEEATQ